MDHSNEYLLWNYDIGRAPYINLLEKFIFEGKKTWIYKL